jgi:hypothetical protein
MTGTWSGVKGHTQMTSDLTVNAPGDWVYATSGGWWTVCGPSTQLFADGRSGNAQGSGSWTNNGTNNIYGMADVSAVANSQRIDIKTFIHKIYIECAIQFFNYPELFWHKYSTNEVQKKKREASASLFF